MSQNVAKKIVLVLGVPIMAQLLTNLTSFHPWPSLWLKDQALP